LKSNVISFHARYEHLFAGRGEHIFALSTGDVNLIQLPFNHFSISFDPASVRTIMDTLNEYLSFIHKEDSKGNKIVPDQTADIEAHMDRLKTKILNEI
jgi:hypothetical protein